MCAMLNWACPEVVPCISWRKLSISLSATWILLSTSRSRSREIRISLRMSSRNLWNDTPCFSSVARNSGSERRFCSAIICTVRSTCTSSARTPVSRAYCTCTRSLIMRSRTCRSSTSGGGNCVPWRLSWVSTSLTRSARSRWVMTSLLTTATMRSTSCGPRCADDGPGPGRASGARGWMPGEPPPGCPEPGMRNCAAALPAIASSRISRTRCILSVVRAIGAGRPRADRCHARPRAHGYRRAAEVAAVEPAVGRRRLVNERVARDAPPQHLERVGSDPCKAVELELHEEERRLLRGRGLELLRDGTDDPAAGIIFDPEERLDGLLALQVVAVAADAVEPAAERPLRCNVDVLDRTRAGGQVLVGVAVRDARDRRGCRRVARAGDEPLDAAAARKLVLRAELGGPARRDAAGEADDERRDVVGPHRLAGNRDLLVGEEVALPDRRAHLFLAVRWPDEPRGDPERELVRVRDPVAAGEDVLLEELAEVEIARRGVEDREFRLIPERDVEIVGARLQRLQVVGTEPLRVALEDEPGVEARDRQRDRRVLLGEAARRGEVVADRGHAHLRLDEAVGGDERPGHPGIRGRAGAGGHQRRVAEAHELAAEAEVDAGGRRPQRVHQELRLAKVRDRHRVLRVLQGLEALVVRGCAPVPGRRAVGGERLLRQVGLGRDREPPGEVAEVVVVRDLLIVHQPGETVQEIEVALERGRVPRFPERLVLREDLVAGLAFRVRRQEPELVQELQAAPRHVAGRDRRVVIGRDVPVERRHHLEADSVLDAGGGRQEAALPLVVERVVEPRNPRRRCAEEGEARTARGGDLALHVDVEFLRLDVPVVLARLARGERALGDAVALVAFETDRRRGAAPFDVDHQARVLDGGGLASGRQPAPQPRAHRALRESERRLLEDPARLADPH